MNTDSTGESAARGWPKRVVSDTGPLLSAFQAQQVALLRWLYDTICVTTGSLPEYERHGAGPLVERLIDSGLAVVHSLTESEGQLAEQISQAIAQHPLTRDRDAQTHYPEAEAIALFQRHEFLNSEILLDELAARQVARGRGVHVIGFPGILIRCCNHGRISPEDVASVLRRCQALGTNYATSSIDGIYERLRSEQNG